MQVYTKTLLNFTAWLRWYSNSQDSHPIRCAGCCNNKKGNFREKKIAFQAKNRQKNGFFGVCRSTLSRFWNSLYDFHHAQTHKIVAYFDAQGAKTIKKITLGGKICLLSQKTSKKNWFSGVFWQYPSETLRNFTVWLRSRSHSQDSH